MTPALPRSQFVDRDGIRLHHLDWGNHGRHPIVLVHGSRLHAHVWNDFSRRLSDRFHIIAVDQRGHGDSGWGAEDGYQLEELYRDLRAVIQARGFARYTLIGHSLGGRVSMLYAHRHQAELERLILVDITPGHASAVVSGATVRNSEASSLRDFETPDAAVAYIKQLMPRAPLQLVEESVRHGTRLNDNGRYTWKYDPTLLRRRRGQAPAGFDLWSLMKSVSTPTLLQYGSHSDVVTPELAQRMAETMPCCKVERVENAGHGLFTDQPDAFAASVDRFLSA
ncbi:MAG: beta-ketoadipate enol-lactone hydrolase [Betaproteobacteria bacterium]|nr:beta-ketoadipate enol-lactone hydrolase [Betaproteobacteria bacterium]